MSTSEHVYRVHPSIGIARLGNSEEYYIGPETMAGFPVEGSKTRGGLPIRAGTESETITSDDLRDRDGAFKRQAARFRVYQYPKRSDEQYPCGDGVEIQIGSVVDGRKVKDIIWTVHLANKKANWYVLNDALGMAVFEKNNRSQQALRNAFEGSDLNNATRLRKLVIDPGPRTIRGANTPAVRFDRRTMASYCAPAGEVKEISSYPKTFPDDGFSSMFTPVGQIETLGELRTDRHGRLLVLGGYGKACAWTRPDGTPYPLSDDDVNSDGWFDDTSDGPVSAVLVFEDGKVEQTHAGWVVATDPGYAPQTLNVVSLWEDIYDTWVRKIGIAPEIFGQKFNETYEPWFDLDIFPIFLATSLQRWNTNLPDGAIRAHNAVGEIKGTDDPSRTIMAGLAFIRNPNNPAEANVGAPLMPLSLGDAGKPFLTLSPTQYFFLTRWSKKQFRMGAGPKLGPGEALDKTVLVNCLGGRFSPGIDMTFLVRDPDIYIQDWQETGSGPFRIRAKPLDYNHVQASQPFLTVGYVPLELRPDGLSAPLEPGDTSKFMAIPWHTDYNSCATHPTSPNPLNSTTLYWSWPAQRPVNVFLADEVGYDGKKLGPQRYSVRGAGTYTTDLSEAGRYQILLNMVLNWHRIGVVIQSTAIRLEDAPPQGIDPDYFLETQSQLDEPDVAPWPMNGTET